MRKIIVQEFITLDGVIQAPGGSEEDESGSFRYGGWTAPYFREADDAADKFMKRWMESTDILLGRKTFDLFSTYWPAHAEMWPGINDVTKYVASTTLTENKSEWPNCEFLKDIDAIKKLKQTPNDSNRGDIKVHGSGNLAQSLLKHDLVDELCLMTFPITLGKGKRLFDEHTVSGAWTLTDSLITKNGVIFTYYKRAGEVKTGTVGA